MKVMTGNAPDDLVGEILECINTVSDPCSVAAGATAGLVDMGLVAAVELEPGSSADRWNVTVTIRLTEPTCWMGFSFTNSARDALSRVGRLENASVDLSTDMDWTPQDATPEFQRQLTAIRRRKALYLGLATVDEVPR